MSPVEAAADDDDVRVSSRWAFVGHGLKAGSHRSLLFLRYVIQGRNALQVFAF